MVKVVKQTVKKDPEKELKAQRVLKSLQKKSEEEEASALAKQYDLPYVDLNLVPLNSEDAFLISQEESDLFRIGIIQKAGKKVRLAVADPGDEAAKKFIAEELEGNRKWEIKLYVVSQSSLSRITERYQDTPLMDSLDLLHMSLTGEDLENFEREFGDLIDLKKKLKDIPTSDLLNTVLSGGIKMKASDIHFESQEKEVRIRFRIDGMLQDIGDLPPDTYRFLISRIKMLSKMKINIRDIAQDGHFSVKMKDSKVDIRVNVIPGNHGENAVLRILNQSNINVQVEDLGLRGLAYEIVQKEIQRPNGMILTTGPTGSGKTTTLYALINKLNTPEVKIITIEDPVEYEISGIEQTEVHKDQGYTFAKGLRAIVRQDPDVVLVGEIRDEETASIAVNAALTGHLVLSTLHTNNAPASVPRLVELGIKPTLIGPAVNAFVAQRLVRKLCVHCRQKYEPAKETVDSIKRILTIISPKAKISIPKDVTHFYKPAGCPKCNNLGYQGRVGIFEVLTISEKIEQLVLDMAGEADITRAALEEGMVTMAQDGILKALEGITTIEEVWRVSGQGEFLEEMYRKMMEQSYSRFINLSPEEIDEMNAHSESFEKIAGFINGLKGKKALNASLVCALLLGGADIYFEPAEQELNIRIRIDGILHSVGTISLDEYPSLISEIKFISGMDSDSQPDIQESRFAIHLEKEMDGVNTNKIDAQASIVKGGFGNTIIIHLLHKSALVMGLEELEIPRPTLETIMKAVSKPSGMFITSGPSNSGKTTTLYSLIKVLNRPEVKIMTVENPIEYRVEGVLQTEANTGNSDQFAESLHSLTRQNPDILMIGELAEGAATQIAVQAALGGHLIITSVQANDVFDLFQKISYSGVRTQDFATSLNALMSQRLVRKLCSCKKKVKASPEEKSRIEKIIKALPASAKAELDSLEISEIFKSQGCPKCNGLGYKGRVMVSEVLLMNNDIRELLYQQSGIRDIQEKAREQNMLTMMEDGILKVAQGITSIEEVDRVIH